MEFMNELSYNGKVPIEHTREIDTAEGEWLEVHCNHRLNLCDDIFYMVENDQIIAHVGLSENQIKTIYVQKEFRCKRIATQMYEALMKIYPVLLSDDAREEPAQIIWEKFLEKYPNQVTYNKKKDIFEFRK